MPSPIGHTLGGVSAGWLVNGAGRDRWWFRRALLFAAVGMLPDVDLVFGSHSGPTHSLGAALIVSVLAWIVLHGAARRRDTDVASALAHRPLTFSLGVFAAYASHLVLDW